MKDTLKLVAAMLLAGCVVVIMFPRSGKPLRNHCGAAIQQIIQDGTFCDRDDRWVERCYSVKEIK